MAGDQGIDGAFRHILDAISDGVYVTGPDRTIVYWSAGAERITGYTADDVVGHRCDEEILIHTDLAGSRLCVSGCPLQDCIDTGREHSISEVFLKRKDGERLAVYVKTAMLEIDGRRHGVEIFGE
ncbi:MAG TPA: PAS domain S-box protein, partial [Thermoleophilia bacterium]